MKLSTLISELKGAVQNVTGITQQKVGYLQEMNTGKETFDAFLLIPPKMRKHHPNNDSEKEYVFEWYLFKLDKGGSSNGRMTEAEKTLGWESLEQDNTKIMDELISMNTAFRIVGGYELDFDSSDGGGGLNLPVIWVKVNCIFVTDHCNGL